jgi:hypothetical protein
MFESITQVLHLSNYSLSLSINEGKSKYGQQPCFLWDDQHPSVCSTNAFYVSCFVPQNLNMCTLQLKYNENNTLQGSAKDVLQ